MAVFYVVIAIAIATFIVLARNFIDLKNHDEGTEEMQDLAKIIRDGASTFLSREYRVIVPTVVVVALIYMLFMEVVSGFTFILGAMMSSCACLIGMRGGTYGNVRTTNAARVTKHMSRTIRIALMSGSISGFAVPAFGIFGACIVWITSGGINFDATGTSLLGMLPNVSFGTVINPLTMRLTTYSLGCSLVAMFNRVAGGNYTKAADISADLVGKNVMNLPEDDSRMPNTIADFIGDCVNDIAGNVSDLLESFVATPVATILITTQAFRDNLALLGAASIYPFILAGGGLLASVVGVNYIIIKNKKQIKMINGVETEVSREGVDPEEELNNATIVSAIAVAVIGLFAAKAVFGNVDLPAVFKAGWISPWIAAVLGMGSSVAVGKLTEVYTSLKSQHVKDLAYMATEGEAFVVTEGDAIGSRSILAPCSVIVVSMIISCSLCGIYGIAIAALGMLSFVGTTVSIDAFGPVADNAGGIAESCHLDPEVRVITDELDAVGNTTAAIGKGNAIGAAAFATVALIMSFIGSFPSPDFSDPMTWVMVIGGMIIGGALIEFFTSILTKNTITAAKDLADAGARQLNENPEILEGKMRPDYESIISKASDDSLGHMFLPAVLALAVPVVCGFLFGPVFILGLLIGSTVVAIGRALFMGNSGGAFDNAKKFIECGMLYQLGEDGEPIKDKNGNFVIIGKGTSAHKAAVTGDTVGDTRKDVVGVALDIFIKMMSTVSNTLAPMFYAYRLF
ncbi:sodium/proton-translocating pyrophosphatase [Candidatus Saccharibacteria bacterium]|nr:sodium/proton-translocating pyrophosphatase [Candidatus Saccharibacteria bacterium]